MTPKVGMHCTRSLEKSLGVPLNILSSVYQDSFRQGDYPKFPLALGVVGWCDDAG